METIKTIYKIGSGPSSSHTMGPETMVKMFLKKYPNTIKYKAELYGSLALTGRGHLSDVVIKNTFKEIDGEVKFDIIKQNLLHPNQMKIIGKLSGGSEVSMEGISVGGGNIKLVVDNKIQEDDNNLDVYKHNNLKDIIKYCEDKKINLVEYVKEFEDNEIENYLKEVYKVMRKSIKRGISTEGLLPGKLKVKRRANKIYNSFSSEQGDKSSLLSAYAYAVNEENASGGIISSPYLWSMWNASGNFKIL